MALARNRIFKATLFMGLTFLLGLQLLSVQSVSANVAEIETEQLQISKTEPGDSKDSSDGGGGDIPWYEKVLNDIKDFGEQALNKIEEFGETLKEGWGDFKEWVADSWIADTWEWLKDNEWVQTIIAGITATIVIVGGIVIVVGTFPAWGTVAIIGGLAVGAGFLYQWLAGDNYSFWGALGSSFIGGILGYVGVATGGFAYAWTWLRGTAGPATWNWLKGTAWPWIVRQGQAGWGWLKGTAWPWMLRQGRAGWTWLKGTAWPWLKGIGTTFWTKLSAPYAVPNVLSIMFRGAGIGTAAGVLSNLMLVLLGEETLSFKNILIDGFLGGLTGGLLAPIFLPGVALSGTLLTGIGVWGGFENWLSGGLKEGEWLSLENFIIGGAIAVGSSKLLSPLINRFVPDDVTSDSIGKVIEETLKGRINDGLDQIKDSGEKSPKNNSGSVEKPNQEVNPSPEPEVEQGPSPEIEPEVDERPNSEVEPEVEQEQSPEIEPEVDERPSSEVEPEVEQEQSPEVEPEINSEGSDTKPQPEVNSDHKSDSTKTSGSAAIKPISLQ